MTMAAGGRGWTVARRLDPRSKLALQAGFGIAVFARPDLAWLAAATLAASAVLALVGRSPVSVLAELRYLLVFFLLAPLVAGVTLESPWFDPAAAATSALALGRVVPVLLVSAAYVHTTPVRETRAAVQRTVPGRVGQLLGVGVGLVFRFFPLLREDLRTARDAVRARGGDRRSTVERARRIGVLGLDRAFTRADRLAVALQARCFAWNPTLPELAFSWRDVPVLGVAVVLGLSPLLPV